MRDKLGIAIIGCGAISYANAEAIHKSTNARLSYAMDVNIASAKAFGEKYSIPFTARLEDVLSTQDVDAVFICTPHYLHKTIAQQAAAAEKHVIVEKPMGSSLEDSQQIVQVCKNAEVKLSVCYCMRYSEKIHFAKSFIDQGGIGDLIGFQLIMLRDRSDKYLQRDTWQEGNPNWHGVKAKSGGGIFIDNFSHYLDYFRYLTGSEIESVQCQAGTYSIPVDVEDNLWALLKTDKGAFGTVVAGSSIAGAGQANNSKTVNSLQRLWGTHGQIILIPELKIFSRKRIEGYEPNRWHTIKPARKYNSGGAGLKERKEFVDRFAIAVQEDREPDITGKDGIEVMEIIDAVYRASKSGSNESL